VHKTNTAVIMHMQLKLVVDSWLLLFCSVVHGRVVLPCTRYVVFSNGSFVLSHAIRIYIMICLEDLQEDGGLETGN
jgi:hypothetical protein